MRDIECNRSPWKSEKKKSHFTQWVQLSPKDKKFSPGKNTRVDCHALLQRIFLTRGSNPSLYHPLHWHAGSLLLAQPGEPLWSIQCCLNLRSWRKRAVCWQFLFRETDYVQWPFIGSMVTTVTDKSFNLRPRKNSHIIFFNPFHRDSPLLTLPDCH